MKISAHLEKLSCLLLGFLVIENGVINHLLGEVTSEGLALFVTLLYLANKLKYEVYKSLLNLAFLIFCFIIFNLILIIFSDEWTRALFIYPYIFIFFLILLPIYKRDNGLDNSNLVKVLTVFACISSFYAIAQRVGFETMLPLEGELRATGLSRSSLNLTGCLLAIFGMGILVAKDDYVKLMSQSIIFLGILAAGGRGGIISALILLIVTYINKFKQKNFAFITCILSVLIMVFFGDWFFRAFSALNFTNDQSNLDRIGSYAEFFKQFKFFGGGIGTTSSAALRFHNATGFESSFLNAIYEIGVPFSTLFLILFIAWCKNLNRNSKILIYKFTFSLLPVIAGQQLYGIPSAFCTLILAIFVLASYREPITLWEV